MLHEIRQPIKETKLGPAGYYEHSLLAFARNHLSQLTGEQHAISPIQRNGREPWQDADYLQELAAQNLDVVQLVTDNKVHQLCPGQDLSQILEPDMAGHAFVMPFISIDGKNASQLPRAQALVAMRNGHFSLGYVDFGPFDNRNDANRKGISVVEQKIRTTDPMQPSYNILTAGDQYKQMAVLAGYGFIPHLQQTGQWDEFLQLIHS